jgi:hypothetical protein
MLGAIFASRQRQRGSAGGAVQLSVIGSRSEHRRKQGQGEREGIE